MTTAPQPTRGPAGRAGHLTGRPPAEAEDVDVLFLAGQRPPAGGVWLLVTAADGQPGGVFTAQVLPGAGPYAFGGDVVVRLAPGGGTAHEPPPAVCVQVWAVLAGRLVPVAAWDEHGLDGWPERIRPAVVFTMSVFTDLEEHGAGLRAHARVDLDAAAQAATLGIPLHATFPASAPPGRPPG